MYGVNAEALGNRQKKRSCYHQSGAAFKEHTHYQKHNIDKHQEDIFVAGQVCNRSSNNLREINVAHIVAECTGRYHDQNNAGSTCNRIQQDGDKMLLKAQLFIHKFSDHKAVQHGNCAAFCRCEQAKTHSKDDSEREEQPPERDKRLLQHNLHRRELLACRRIFTPVSYDCNHNHHTD